MPTNEFYTYATDGGSPNVESLVAYATDTVRDDGAVAGLARADVANRAWRQGANMASAVGEAIIHKTALDALDDGDITGLRDAIEEMIAVIAREQYAPPGTTIQMFTSSTSFVVPDGVTYLRGKTWGGGGGGGGNTTQGGGGGGGGGGYAENIIAVTPGETLTLTVGAGGTAGSNAGGSAAANSGGNGGLTRILRGATVLISANGGTGGEGSLSSGQGAHGPGGAGTVGAVIMTGSNGNAGSNAGTNGFGGFGGGAAAGGGGSAASSGLPSAANGPGGGGAGGGGNYGGTAGAAGAIVLEH